MSLMSILHYPNPKLRQNSEKVMQVDQSIQKIIADMLETMYEEQGCGLAAIQVGIPKQIIVMDLSSRKNEPFVFINPEIISSSGEMIETEGCLSLPGVYEKVVRASDIKMRALDQTGKSFELEAHDDYLSVCIQHEMDHLFGKLFIDRLSSLKRQRVLKKLKKIQKIAY